MITVQHLCCAQVMGLAVLGQQLYVVTHKLSEIYVHETVDPFVRVGPPKKIDKMQWPRGIAASQKFGCVFVTDWYRMFRGRIWRATENIEEVLSLSITSYTRCVRITF